MSRFAKARTAEVADNVGAALSVSLGIAATGLTVTTRAAGAAFWIGVVVGVLGGLFTLATLLIALETTRRTWAFRSALGRALGNGTVLLHDGPGTRPDETETWGKDVHDLIFAGLGEWEAALFLSNADLNATYAASDPTIASVAGMYLRLQRLARLLDRVHALHVAPWFDSRRADELFPGE